MKIAIGQLGASAVIPASHVGSKLLNLQDLAMGYTRATVAQ